MDDTQTSRDEDFSPGFSSVQQERSDPEPSCVSMRSDWSRDIPIDFKKDDTQTDLRSILTQRSAVTKPVCEKNDPSMNQLQDCNESSHEVLNTFRSNLMKKFQHLYEGTAKQGNPTLLNEIYTELYITEGDSGEISNEHEVRQIETQSRRAATEDTPIKCNDIFRPLPGQDKPIRTVLTKGVAGIGKTVSVQKFILDWAEGKVNQDVQLIFPLPFRELNLMKNKTLSLSDLLHVFFPEPKQMEISSDKYKVLFIFDGLDECRLSLDFQSDVRLCDVSESASVDVLLMNLIAGNLLPSALIWITSRPAAAELVPSKCVHRVTEVRGFNEPQKEEYFRKRISDWSLTNKIISHLKSSRSLYIMCHIPVFCWISATVLEKMLTEAESGEIPKTLTQMYTSFLILQTNIKDEKDYEKNVTDEDMILKLGKVAFQQLVKGNVIFYEDDLRECGIDVTEASVYSGLCSQIFREESGLYQAKVFCFVHLSIQEHLAALYVHLSCTNNNINVFDSVTKPGLLSIFKDLFHYNSSKQVSFSELHQRAVNEALQSKNGHLDLFLRFLLGLSVESHQILLQGLITLRRSQSDRNEKTAKYIKEKIRTIDSPEKSINLFHCLNELGDHSLVEEIQQYLKSGTISEARLSSSQWSAVAFVLLTSEKKLDGFDINTFVGENNKAEKLMVLQNLMPVIKVHLSDCGVTEKDCAALTSVLTSNPSQLRELNMNEKKLRDSGVKLLSVVLEDPDCKLEKLWLRDCGVTDEGCAALASALRSNPSHLRHLNLSVNKLGDSVHLLSAVLEDPRCKLETLW
ncbi:NLR family CARD domain-containing protein 3-like [Megalobrama amblycephala]|uniref:NLR family CARD domain-containing protein 3-like n=1 Tax=Megalobrama amblycephala TaxID=75352 RepID=UPI002013F6EB|nr:NLR family CARD domain-containing protein 3-like [Megalobrama amblycephala]